MWQSSHITVSAALHVIVCQMVPAIDGHLDTKIIPEAYQLMGLECDVEVKEGHLLQPTSVVASSSNAKDVAMLSHHCLSCLARHCVPSGGPND